MCLLCHSPYVSPHTRGICQESAIMAPLFVCHRAISHSSVALGSTRKWEIDKGTFFYPATALSGERSRGKGQREGEMRGRGLPLDRAHSSSLPHEQIFALDEFFFPFAVTNCWSNASRSLIVASYWHFPCPLPPINCDCAQTPTNMHVSAVFFPVPVGVPFYLLFCCLSSDVKFLDICKTFHT